ncbi:hypothetical protein D3C75_757900 [compost metagenome]
MVGQAGLGQHPGRAIDGPRPKQLGQAQQQAAFGGNEPQAHAGQAEELAERAQHDQPRALGTIDHAIRRGVVHERFVDQQPTTAGGQARMPIQQAFTRHPAAGGVVGVDQHQYVEAVERRLYLRFVQLQQLVPRPLPGVWVLGIARRQHPYPAGCAQQRQGLDRGLGTGHRQQLAGAVIRTRGVLQAVLGLRQAGPGLHGNRWNRERPWRNAAGQVEPLLAGDAVLPYRPQQAASVFKH